MITENESVKLIFGLKIRSLRQQKGLSYQQLSEASKITVSYLHDIENGKKYPKADKILALAKVLGSDYDYLVSLTGDKKIQPLIDLISSDFINVIPWEHFGIAPSSLLEIFSNTPDKVTAFISTLVKISRAYHLTKDNFYTTALRSYQDIHDNYFEELEAAATTFREQHTLPDALPCSVSLLEELLLQHYQISVDRKRMGNAPALSSIRSFFSEHKNILYLNKQFSAGQEAFLVAREIAFQYLQLKLRPYETIVQEPSSFDLLLNNFRASYFAAALLIPEEFIVEDIRNLSIQEQWNANLWRQLLSRYHVSPEMLFQRLTNILPYHFNIGQLFFLRISGNEAGGYEITKELHLSQLHNPHANLTQEHYCRRWLGISLMKQLENKEARKKPAELLVDTHISHYHQTHNRYLCISMAKPKAKGSDEMVSVTIGLLLDSNLMHLMRFVNDQQVVTRTVHTTCERCSITDCMERAAAPSHILQLQRQREVHTALQHLDR